MNLLTRIRYYLAEISLKKLVAGATRDKAFINFSDARSVAVIFDATPDGNLDSVKRFVAQLKEKKKQVKAVGFFDQKFTPTNISYSKADFDFYNLKELNPLFFPSSPYLKTFAEENFDLFIDLNLHDKFPLRTIAISSKAKCKVGIDIPQNRDVHDFFIATNDKENVGTYLSLVEKSMNMINR
jgi:hypothetical protein